MDKVQQLLDRARAYAKKGRARPTLETYAAVCRLKPRDPDPWIESGESGIKFGDTGFAAMALFGGADLYAQQGQVPQAIALCERVLALAPDHEGARRLARMLEGRRRRMSAGPSGSRLVSRTETSRSTLPAPQTRLAQPPPIPKQTAGASAFDGMLLGSSDEVTDFPLDDEDEMKVVQAVAATVSSSPLLSELDSDLVRYLIDCSSVVYSPTGKIIIREGEADTSLYLILQGSVRVERTNPKTGVHETLTSLRRGAFFGEMALLTDAPRNATVRSAEPTTLLKATREAVRELIRKDKRVLKLLMRFFRSRMVTNLVASSDLFAPFTAAECRMLTTQFQLRELPPGYVVVEQGHPADGLYLVLVGSLHVFSNANGRRQELGSLFPGDVFAEMSLMDGVDATATITTSQRAWLLCLPRAQFRLWVEEHPRLREQLDEIASSRRRTSTGTAPLSMSPV